MATESETIQIIIKLRDQASRGFQALGRGISGLRSTINGVGGAVFGLKAALAGLGVGLIAKGFVQTAASFEAMEVKLDALTKGRGVETLERINEWALRMPVDTRQAVNTFAMMQAMGLDPTIEKMETLVDVSVLFGEDALPRIARALGQMATLGRLSAEDLNQLSEVGINARKYLSEAFGGKTVEEIQKAGIEMNKVIAAIMNGLREEFGGSAAKMQQSWQGLTTTLISYWVEFQRRVMASGVFDTLKKSLGLLANEIDKLFKSGRIDIWAHEVAVGVLSAFQLMTQAVGVFVRSVISVQGIMNRIGLEWKKLQLDRAVKEFNILVDALNRGQQTAELHFIAWQTRQKELVGTNWQEAVKKRIEELNKEIQTLGDSGGKSADALVKNIDNLKTFTGLIEKAVKALKEAKEASLKEERVPAGAPPPTPKPAPAPKVDQKVLAAQAKAEIQQAIEVNKTLVAKLEQQWRDHNISLEEYFRNRTNLINEQFRLQLQLLDEAKARAKPEQVPAIETQKFAVEQQHLRDMVTLEAEYRQAIKDRSDAEKEADEVLRNIRERIMAAGVGESLGAQQELEREQLLQQQKEDIDALLELKRQGYDIEQQMLEAHLRHVEEREQQSVNQRKQIIESWVGGISQTLSGLQNTFLEFYKASGEKNKEMFAVFKAVSIAQALVATYESATKAYSAMAGIPYVGPALGIAAAAAAIASGLAKVALIRRQQFAEGGEIKGYSPHRKADNIPIMVTAGEFVQPVDVVKYYGTRAMHAIRRKLISREDIDELIQRKTKTETTIHPPPKQETPKFAEGGLVGKVIESAPKVFKSAKSKIVKTKDKIFESIKSNVFKSKTARSKDKSSAFESIKSSVLKSDKSSVFKSKAIRLKDVAKIIDTSSSKFIDISKISKTSKIIDSSKFVDTSKAFEKSKVISSNISNIVKVIESSKEYFKSSKEHIVPGFAEGGLVKAIPQVVQSIPKFAGISIVNMLPKFAEGGIVQFKKTVIQSIPEIRFATGGMVPNVTNITSSTNVAGPAQDTERQQEVNIYNVMDPTEMLRVIHSPDGEEAVLNVISSNREVVGRILR